MAAFDGLERLRFIEVTQKGYLDRTTFQGKVTRIVARDELLERLNELEGHPACLLALRSASAASKKIQAVLRGGARGV